MFKKNTICFLFFLLVLSLSFATYGQNDEGFIYGKLTTKAGNEYIGQMRWGKEEVFWNDIFNSVKSKGNKTVNVEIKVEHDENTELTKEEVHKWKLMEIWDDQYSGLVHQFTTRFGDIRSIIPLSNDYVTIIFKNGFEYKVRGGSNDVGTDIYVMDYELGIIKISWNNIARIDFFDSPATIKRKFGVPLYGTVRTNSGNWTGLVQWDNDERLDIDLLDGYYQGTELHIPFGQIKCINKKDCKSEIVKSDDTHLILSGTNDVNCENRGIIVSIDDIGRISIPWSSFQQLCLDHKKNVSGQPYRTYPEPRRLNGEVKTLDQKEWKGQIVFDMDESWDLEHLEGNAEGIKYIIPFRYISAISPRNNNFTNVILKNGQRLLLGDLQDVSDKNEGILIYTDAREEPISVDWKNVDEIIFE